MEYSNALAALASMTVLAGEPFLPYHTKFSFSKFLSTTSHTTSDDSTTKATTNMPTPLNQPRPMQLPTQPVSNPDNKTIQSTDNIGLVTYPTFPTYCIAPHLLQEIYFPML